MDGIDALRNVLKRSRWDSQGGYPSYMGDGKWAFASTSLSGITPEELNALFNLAGIVPDKIERKGACSDCVYSINGRERGYEEPCLSCKRPQMSNFEEKGSDEYSDGTPKTYYEGKPWLNSYGYSHRTERCRECGQWECDPNGVGHYRG